MLGSIKSRPPSHYERGQDGGIRKLEIFLLADTPLGVKKIPPNVFHVLPHFFQL